MPSSRLGRQVRSGLRVAIFLQENQAKRLERGAGFSEDHPVLQRLARALYESRRVAES